MSLTSIRKQVYSTLHTQRHRSAIDTEFYCKASATTAMRDGQKVNIHLRLITLGGTCVDDLGMMLHDLLDQT